MRGGRANTDPTVLWQLGHFWSLWSTAGSITGSWGEKKKPAGRGSQSVRFTVTGDFEVTLKNQSGSVL